MGQVKNYVMGIEEDIMNIDGFETMVNESGTYTELANKLLEKPEFIKIFDQYGAAWVRDILQQVWDEYSGTQYV